MCTFKKKTYLKLNEAIILFNFLHKTHKTKWRLTLLTRDIHDSVEWKSEEPDGNM